MGYKIDKGYCQHCGDVKVEINTPNHILHLFLTLFTGGIWIIVWLFMLDNVRCSKCGSKASNGFITKFIKSKISQLGPTENTVNNSNLSLNNQKLKIWQIILFAILMFFILSITDKNKKSNNQEIKNTENRGSSRLYQLFNNK